MIAHHLHQTYHPFLSEDYNDTLQKRKCHSTGGSWKKE